MPSYMVTTEGVAREVYIVEADSPESLAEMFEMGGFPRPLTSEIESVEIVAITPTEGSE